MAKNTENKQAPSAETEPVVPVVEVKASYPCSVQEYCSSKGLNSFNTKVFVKAMAMEKGVGKQAKFLFSEWDARRDEFYKRPAT